VSISYRARPEQFCNVSPHYGCGIIGAAGIQALGDHELGLVDAILVAASLIVSEFAARRIAAFRNHSSQSPMVSRVLPACNNG
jgi:hypothetical protein